MLCPEAEKMVRSFIPPGRTPSTSYTCRVCHTISRLQCSRCDGGNHIGCKQSGTPELLCAPCWTETRDLPRLSCAACHETAQYHEFEGTKCDHCNSWFHTACSGITDVQYCDYHGINACTEGDEDSCEGTRFRMLCEECTLSW